jgi:hypothetical protein
MSFSPLISNQKNNVDKTSNKMKTLYLSALLSLYTLAGFAQKQDTVIISLGKTSTIIFTMEDPNDLEILKHYNFQQLFNDMLKKLEDKNRSRLTEPDSARWSATNPDREDVITDRGEDEDIDEADDDDDDDDRWTSRRRERDRDDRDQDDHTEWHTHNRKWSRTHQSFNFDLGLNNFLSDGEFPDDSAPYAVRPWGSWYVGIASVQKSRIARNFFLEWGLGMNWYTFKFEDDNIRIVKTDDGVEFTQDMRDVNFIKSKLSVSYIQASLVPVLDFNDRNRKRRFWDGNKDSFRIGLGPYVGYRISSRSKQVYNDDGREKDKNRDSFYLNNFRYGMRLQLGYRSTDLFFNYDMNELFKEGRGPNVNAFSFGVIF